MNVESDVKTLHVKFEIIVLLRRIIVRNWKARAEALFG